MRRLSLIVALLGIFFLIIISNFAPPKSISSPKELSSLNSNQKVLVSGKVIKETYSKNNLILHLNNNVTLLCPIPCPSLLNKNISAIAKYESFNNNYYLKILKLNYNG